MASFGQVIDAGLANTVAEQLPLGYDAGRGRAQAEDGSLVALVGCGRTKRMLGPFRQAPH
jgi:hypothetical protein